MWLAPKHGFDFCDSVTFDPSGDGGAKLVENIRINITCFLSSGSGSNGASNIAKQQLAGLVIFLKPFEGPNNPFPNGGRQTTSLLDKPFSQSYQYVCGQTTF